MDGLEDDKFGGDDGGGGGDGLRDSACRGRLDVPDRNSALFSIICLSTSPTGQRETGDRS